MRPRPEIQIRWGLSIAGAVLVLLLLFALVPDPFFRQRVMATSLDDVSAIGAGVPVYFRGAEVGAVRSVELDPAQRTFAVRLGIDKDWQPSRCTFARVIGSNPFTTPHVEIVALETPQHGCATARLAAQCTAVPAARGSDVVGCKRPPDLFETAAVAVAEAAEVAKTANLMAARVQLMLAPGGGAGGGGTGEVLANATQTLAALNSMSERIDRSMEPGRGDIALTLANVRRATGQAAAFDIGSLNGTLAEVRSMVTRNQESIAAILTSGKDVTGETRAMLENMSSSLTATSANLEQTTTRLDALSERMAADPTFILRGQKFADPPVPGSN